MDKNNNFPQKNYEYLKAYALQKFVLKNSK